MDLELLVIPDCPGTEQASVLLRAALVDIGLPDASFSVRIIDSDEAARAHAFAGSPAFLDDGTDLFTGAGGPGALACRLYPTPEGPSNLPALRDLRDALRRRVGTA